MRQCWVDPWRVIGDPHGCRTLAQCPVREGRSADAAPSDVRRPRGTSDHNLAGRAPRLGIAIPVMLASVDLAVWCYDAGLAALLVDRA